MSSLRTPHLTLPHHRHPSDSWTAHPVESSLPLTLRMKNQDPGTILLPRGVSLRLGAGFSYRLDVDLLVLVVVESGQKGSEHWVPYPLRPWFWVPFVVVMTLGAVGLEVALFFSNKNQGAPGFLILFLNC